LALGYLKIPYESIVSRYDEPELRQKLSGGTTTPFVVLDNGQTIRESLVIIESLDTTNHFKMNTFKSSADSKEMETLLDQLSGAIHPVTWPFWVQTPEFDEKSRQYTIEKKQKQHGSFAKLFHDKDANLQKVIPLLKTIENRLNPFYQNADFSIRDILIASHLWGLYIVPEFQFSEKMHQYLQTIKHLCHFDYQQDFWKN